MSNWLETLRGSGRADKPACSTSRRARGLSLSGSLTFFRASPGEKATRSAEYKLLVMTSPSPRSSS